MSLKLLFSAGIILNTQLYHMNYNEDITLKRMDKAIVTIDIPVNWFIDRKCIFSWLVFSSVQYWMCGLLTLSSSELFLISG